jgi:predicted GH43/DUF377 family glycosyl hydrolase
VNVDGSRWVKYEGNPVLGGGELGTCFDVAVLVEGDKHRMWFSWRPRRGIGYAESEDGLHWHTRAEVVLGADADTETESVEVTRPYVLVENDGLTMWYAAHGPEEVAIARATSRDGIRWERKGVVLRAEEPWEKRALMCPSVLRDENGTYHLWYSGGERYEPDAIGYATSADGVTWQRVDRNPVLRPLETARWERSRVAGAHVFAHAGWLYAAYIGFADGFEDSSIGIARSSDGINWLRHAGNPVIRHGAPGEFDSINVYKPFVVVDNGEWRLWFNGSSPLTGDDLSPENRIERIGYATCRFEFQEAR